MAGVREAKDEAAFDKILEDAGRYVSVPNLIDTFSVLTTLKIFILWKMCDYP
jgi:hypothetical protein